MAEKRGGLSLPVNAAAELQRLMISEKPRQDLPAPEQEDPAGTLPEPDPLPDPLPEPEKIETTRSPDYQTTSIPDYRTTRSPVVPIFDPVSERNPPLSPSPVASPSEKIDGRRRKPFKAVRLVKPAKPLSPVEAKRRAVEALGSDAAVINFKGPAELNALLDDYLAEHFRECRRDDVKKQDIIARALMLVAYEMATGVDLVDFGDGE